MKEFASSEKYEEAHSPIHQKYLSPLTGNARKYLVWVSVAGFDSDWRDGNKRQDDDDADDRESAGRGGTQSRDDINNKIQDRRT